MLWDVPALPPEYFRALLRADDEPAADRAISASRSRLFCAPCIAYLRSAIPYNERIGTPSQARHSTYLGGAFLEKSAARRSRMLYPRSKTVAVIGGVARCLKEKRRDFGRVLESLSYTGPGGVFFAIALTMPPNERNAHLGLDRIAACEVRQLIFVT